MILYETLKIGYLSVAFSAIFVDFPKKNYH